VPQVKGGRLRALAVTASSRLKELPDVPTLNELMHNDLTVQESWFGLWAPAKTPPQIITKLHVAVSRVLADATVNAQFEAAGNTTVVS
jgi:tripartite-type tricarboxylate transporter receptor subunit TctC